MAQLYLGPDEPQPRWTEKAPAGNCTDPYATESLAVKAGLTRITKMRRPGPNKKELIVFTDSQGLTTALQKGPLGSVSIYLEVPIRSTSVDVAPSRSAESLFDIITSSPTTRRRTGSTTFCPAISELYFSGFLHIAVYPETRVQTRQQGGHLTRLAPSRSAESLFDIITSSPTTRRRTGSTTFCPAISTEHSLYTNDFTC